MPRLYGEGKISTLISKPRISVIIPSYRRAQCLKDVLYDLSHQTFKGFEVVVIDQSPITIESQVKNLQLHLRYLKLDKPSIVRAKNFGISRAKGAIILVLDDDLKIPKGLLEKYHKYWSNLSYSSCSAIAGPALEEEKFIIKRGGRAFGEFSLFGELNTDYREVTKPSEVTAVPGGNLSFKKSAWKAIGGYDEKFKGNCVNEDSDFCLRLTNKCGKIIFDPDLAVKHLRAPGGSRSFGDIKSAQWYEDLFFNHLYFYLMHWPKHFLPLFFVYRMRQVYTCVVCYGRFRKEYLLAAFRGYQAAVEVYFGGRRC